MFRTIFSYLRSERKVAERSSRRLYRAELRHCSKIVSAARKALVVADAQARVGASVLDELGARIGEMESRVALSLEQGRESAAHELASLTAHLVTEYAAIADRISGVTVESVILRRQIGVAEARLGSLKRNSRATIDPAPFLICDPEAMLARLRGGQSSMMALKSALNRAGCAADPARLRTALAKVCCGAPLKISAEAVLARLRSRVAKVA